MEKKKTIEEVFNELVNTPAEDRNRILSELSEKELYELSLYVSTKKNEFSYEDTFSAKTEAPNVLRPYKTTSERLGRAFSERALANHQMMMDSIHEKQVDDFENKIDSRHR